MKTIGLFGGAFDPPHLGHEVVAATLLEKKLVDEVWFVPVYQHPWAKRLGKEDLAIYEHRLAMLQLILGPEQEVKEFRGVSYVYDTLQYFEKLHPDTKFSWIMGSEYLPKFDDFLAEHPQLEDYTFFIYPRKDAPMEPLKPNMKPLKDVEEVAISSTQAREAIQAGTDVTQMLNPKVANYLSEHNLYTGG